MSKPSTAELRHTEEALRFLAIHGYDTNTSSHGPALLSAAFRGSLAAVRHLIEHGADIHHHSDGTVLGGGEAIHAAAAGGHRDVVEYLLQKGVEATTKRSPGDEANPLHLAALQDHRDLVKLLISHGASLADRDKDGKTPLHWASLSDLRNDGVVFLHTLGADLDARENRGASAVHVASWRGKLQTLKHLVGVGASLEAVDSDGATALHWAAGGLDTPHKYLDGKTEVVQYLLEAGLKVDAVNHIGRTPLAFAARCGHLGAARLLIEHKADPLSADNAGSTPLHHAAETKREDMVRYLLSNGGYNELGDNKGNSPLAVAVAASNGGAVEALVEHGADLLAKVGEGTTVLHLATLADNPRTARYLLRRKAKINAQDHELNTSLALAAKNGLKHMVLLLLEAGASDFIPDKHGRKALHHACKNGHVEIVAMLLAHGARPGDFDDAEWASFEDPVKAMVRRAADRWADRKETGQEISAAMSMLFSSAETGHHEHLENPTFMSLLERSADINASDVDGRKPLSVAAGAGHRPTVEWLLEQGALVDDRNKFEETALWCAARYGHSETAQVLLEKGAAVDSPDDFGQTPLHAAATGGHSAVGSLLISHGADVQAQTAYGKTPLFLAADEGHLGMVELLVKSGADINHESKLQQTPLDMATISSHADVKAFLVDKGARSVQKQGKKKTSKKVDLRRPQTSAEAKVAGETATAEKLREETLKEAQKVDERAADQKDAGGEIVEPEMLEKKHYSKVNTKDETMSKKTEENNVKEKEAKKENFKKGNTPMDKTKEGKEMKEVEVDEDKAIENIGKGGNGPNLPRDQTSSEGSSSSDTEDSEDEDPEDQEPPSKSDVYGASLRKAAARGENALASRYLVQLTRAGSSVDHPDPDDGSTALCLAAEYGKDSTIFLLIKHGADVNLADKEGYTPLMYAAEYNFASTIRLLHQHGAKLEAMDNKGRTALGIAAEWAATDVVKVLLELGAELEHKDSRGSTPLGWAAEFDDQTAVLPLLLDAGAMINVQDKYGRTPLYLAAKYDQVDSTRILLQRGAEMQPAAKGGKAPLGVAAREGNEAIVALLLLHGAAVDYPREDGSTALMLAARDGYSMTVKMLIEAGANPDLRNDAGRTALSLAKEFGCEEAIQSLYRASSIRAAFISQREARRFAARMSQTTTHAPTAYQYETLQGPTHVRLLELHPGTDADIISFDIHTADLELSPSYHALSYEWSRLPGESVVQCNGSRFQVTQNLGDALFALRSPTSFRTLWIDAICINQQDIAERNTQVAMMTRIYRQAQTVIMWLGESDRNTKPAFESVSTLSKVFDILIEDAETPGDRAYPDSYEELDKPARERVKLALADLLNNTKAIKGLTSIGASSYFTRAWIFQETLLAGRRGQVMCGKEQRPWQDVKRALAAFFLCRGVFPKKSRPKSKAENVMLEPERIYEVVGSLDLEDASLAMMSLGAADPRDKIYATLGILPNIMSDLRPDYNASVQDVYVKAARHIIRLRQDLVFWNLCNRPALKKIEGLPSWVPDWSIDKQISKRGFHNVADVSPGYFNDLVKGEMITSMTSLHLYAFFLDHVVFIQPVSTDKRFYEGVVKPLAMFLVGLDRSLFHAGSAPFETGLNLEALVGLFDRVDHKKKRPDVVSYLAWKLSIDDDIPLALRQVPESLDAAVKEWQSKSVSDEDFDLEICKKIDRRHSYEVELLYTSQGRFAVTNKSGGELGLRIAVLCGSSLLALLRECSQDGETWYQFVDEAFVKGLKESSKDFATIDQGIQRIELR